MKLSNKRKQAGFTLIEMMVVVAVIGLLIAMVGPRVFNQVEKAERTRVAQDIRVIENALKFYRLDNFRYPTQSQGLEALVTAPPNSENWNGPYLDAVPNDHGKHLIFIQIRVLAARILIFIPTVQMALQVERVLIKTGVIGMSNNLGV